MKFLNSLQGSVVLQASADEALPVNGVDNPALLAYVGEAYKFGTKPQPLAVGPHLPHIFQTGALIKGGEKFPVYQLAIFSNGDMITAATTELADKILDDYTARLDADLGYRFASVTKRRKTYQSNVVVEFEAALGEKIEFLSKIEGFLSKEIPRPKIPFALRRIGFGSASPLTPGAPLSIDALERSDFTIERREGQLNEGSRYFCSAPVQTSEHIRILELLEKEFLK